MKVFKNKTVSRKIIILLLCILLLSFFIPKSVKADDGIGGKLLNPIMSLFVGLGDGAMSLLEKIVLQKDVSLINIDTSASFWSKVIVAVTSLAVIAIAVASVIATGGGSAIAIALGVAKTVITVGSVAVITFPITTSIVEGMLPDSFYLPLYSITPQEIFSNDVLLLDVDFFNPKDNETIQKAGKVETVEVKVLDKKMQELKDKYGFTSLENTEKITNKLGNNLGTEYIYKWEYNGKTYQLNNYDISGGWNCLRFDTSTKSNIEYIFGSDTEYVFDNQTEIETKTEKGESVEVKSTARALRSTIANWYNILRDIALVALLSVLVYVGIRILISSTSSDKAKYKQMIVDWIVAICLLFIMQYIMSFSNLFVDKFISLVDSTKVSESKTTKTTEPEVFVITDKDKVKKAYEALVKDPVKNEKLSSEKDSPYYAYFLNDKGEKAGKDATKLVWPAENFMQQARIKLQLLDSDKNETYVSIGWKLIYVVLVLFTLIFLFTYIKRVVYMAFLTLIAPLVALTYPIDKMNDGQAQAFNAWFKEYIFNLIIQPMHLILYTILISSAMDFASENILYVIVALGFMVPAEKLLRKFFGFNKADTPGILAGPAGAALMMNGMNKLLGKGPKGGKPPVSKNGKNVDSLADEKPPRINNDFDKDKALFGDGLDGISTSTNKNNVNDTTNNSLLQGENKLLDDEADLMKNSLGTGNKLSEPLKNNKIGVNGNNINSKNIQAQNPKRSIKRAIGMAGRYYVNKKAKGIANKMQNGHPIRTVAKLGAGVVGATAAGAAGLALGVTSGDPSKAAQYIATGALGGYRVGSGIPDKFDTSGMNDLKEVAKLGYYGSDEEYNYVQQQKYIKDYQNNDKNMLELEQKYGNEEAKRIMKEDIPTLLNNGVTDIKDIAAIEDMIKDNKISVNSVDEGIAVKKYASRIGEDSTKMTAKKREEWQKTFANEFGNKEKYKGHDHLKMANSVLNKVDEFNKTKK